MIKKKLWCMWMVSRYRIWIFVPFAAPFCTVYYVHSKHITDSVLDRVKGEREQNYESLRLDVVWLGLGWNLTLIWLSEPPQNEIYSHTKESIASMNPKYSLQNCHNPTNNPKQLKTTFVGVVILLVRKKHHTTTPRCDYN